MTVNKHIPFICGILGAFLFIVTSIFGGIQIEGYSFVSQFISESYATGIANVEYLQYSFIVSGILLALYGFLAPTALPKSNGIKIGFVLFAVFYGLGTVTTGFFPCDYGCPTDSKISVSQFIHNASGFLTYAITPLCLIGLGLSFKSFLKTQSLSYFTIVCGIVALVFVLFLFGNPTGSYIGLFQRIIETAILSWVIYCSFYLLRTIKD